MRLKLYLLCTKYVLFYPSQKSKAIVPMIFLRLGMANNAAEQFLSRDVPPAFSIISRNQFKQSVADGCFFADNHVSAGALKKFDIEVVSNPAEN